MTTFPSLAECGLDADAATRRAADFRAVLGPRLRNLGFTLAETKNLIGVTRGSAPRDPGTLRIQAESKLAEVDEKIRGLELLRSELRAVVAAECDSLIDCDCGDCPIEEHAPVPRPRLLQGIR
jgi:hypothetical protein